MVRKTAVAIVCSILVVAAAVWLLLPQIQATAAQIIAGRVAIPLVALLALWRLLAWVFPEEAKLFIANVLRKIGYLPLGLRRLVVRNEVEGSLNKAVREFGCEGTRLLPYPASLVWVSPGELSRDSFFRDGRIIIKLDYSENPQRNVVESSILYCKEGLVRETRRYLWNEFRRALDLAFVRAVLERNNLQEGLLYFVQEVVGRELTGNPAIEKDYEAFSRLNEQGYFTRILLPELRDYAGRVNQTDTQKQHKTWISEFVAFLMEITQERPLGTKFVLDHIRKRFRVSVIIVGERWKLALQGQRPYLKRIARCASLGARNVVLIGEADAVPAIARSAKRMGLVDSSECQTYHASRRRGVRRVWCAHLRISEETAASALSRVPGIEEWPEFETGPEHAETDVQS